MTSYLKSLNDCAKAILRNSVALTLALAAIGLSGCSNKGYMSAAEGTGVTGSVFGGQNPVSGSLIQLYAVGTTGDGSAATPLISATVTTSDGTGQANSNANAGNANNTLPVGLFTITGDYTCPSASAEVYLVSKGGNPGLGTGVNANLTLMAGLGQCGNLSSSTVVYVNELTTVSTLAALSNFATSYSALGSGTSDATQLQSQFAEVNEYVNIANGTVPGPTLPAGYSASSTAIQTLGDIVAACVNSAGGVAGDNSACGNLFSLATIGSNPAPTDTVGAIINILSQPTVNTTQIFALLPANNPFEPTLSSAPASWALPITSGTATKLVYTVAPSNTAAGSVMSPSVSVTIEDVNGNAQTSATNPVTIVLGANPSNGTLSGTTTVNAVNGVATFNNLSINKTGTGYTLAASSAGLTGFTSGTFNITPGAATKLAFGVQPSNTPAGSSISPAVTVLIEDANSNTVTTSTATVTMAVGTNPSSGTLTGTSANAVAGVATFSASSINSVGNGYTLAASSTGLTGATSNTFNITGPSISVGATTVGNNFIVQLSSLSLPGPAPATEFLTLTSNDPTHFLLSTSPTVVGTASIQLQLTSGSSSIPGTVYLQGQNYSGTTAITGTLTASATGFTNGTGTQTLYPSGVGFDSSSFNTNTLASPTGLTVGLLCLAPGTLTATCQGTLGPQGASPTFTITSGTTTVGTMSGNPYTYTVNGGTYGSQNVTFVPVGAGTSTLTINEPAGYFASTSPNWPSSITATVSAPTISVGATTVGNNFVTNFSIGLQSAPAAADTFTVSVSDSTHFLLSLSPTTIGAASLMIPVVKGGSIPTIYLEGQNYSGNVAINAALSVTDSLSAYSPGTGTATLYPSGIGFNSSSFSTTTLSSPTSLTVGLLCLTPGTLSASCQGTLGPQATNSPNFTISSGTTTVGTMSGNPYTFTVNGGTYGNGGVTFVPVGGGTSTLTLNLPTGYLASTSSNWPTSITATVSAPTINVPSGTIVGNNFVNNFSVGLQSAPTAADTFTVSVNDSTHFLLSLSPTTVGTASLVIPVAKGGSIPTIYLEGQNYSGNTAINATVTVADSLNAYTPDSGSVELYPSGVGFNSSSFSTTTFASPTSLTVGLLTLTPGTLTAIQQGTLGPQATNSPNLTITSGTTTVGTISGNPYTFTVNGGTYGNGGVTFVPAGSGTSTLTLNLPTGYLASTSSNWPTSITATVSAPTISVGATTVGNNFITGLSLSLQSAPPTSETMTITSNDPTHFLLSTSPTVVGSASVTVTLTAGSGSIPSVYLQGQNFNNNPVAWTTSVTASAPGYTTGSGTQTLYPSGLGFNSSSFSTSTSASPTGLTVGLLGLTPGTFTAAFQGTLGPQGASPSFTITSGTPATGTISGNPGTFTVNGGTYESNTVSFVPAGVGTSTLTLNQPAGYTASTSSNWPSQITATVGP